MQDIIVHVGKGDAVILADQRFRLFRIALGPAYADWHQRVPLKSLC
jgi:hypothetical protein